jgi:thiol-disulfide isomerase/thioredoxin
MARLVSEKESDPAALIYTVTSAVSVEEPDPAFFAQARDIVSELEQLGHTGAASEIAVAVGTAYGRFDNEQVAEVARLWAESVKRRLSIIGSQVEIDGVLSTGEAFDWPAQRGKVVLIDFWATWCPPCLKLLPELEALHAEYHDQGFEIVGVSLDNDRAVLDQFLAQRKLPWPILANIAGKPQTEPEQNADRYGVEAIPVVILVDKQGKAIATGLHGEALAARVKQLLAE